MLYYLKKFFKKLLPVTINKFDKSRQSINKSLTENKNEIQKLKNEIIELNKSIKKDNDIIIKKLIELNDLIKKDDNILIKNTNEIVWAEVFNNTIKESTWLKNKSCSPARWAAGYSCMYVIYRVLNNIKPKSILELGLGQSTRLTAQYVEVNNAEHIIIEHDKRWIDFFCNDFNISNKSRIIQLDREFISYKDAEAVRVFKNFKSTLINKKFDFIFIDAPLGGDMKCYARIDILSILPNCLKDNFVILLDDCNRIGEKNTLKEVELILKNNSINYCKGIYSGQKNCAVICSEDLSFISTM